MEKRKLGRSDMEVGVVSLGAWAYGKTPSWREVEEKEVVEIVYKAVDLGINLIDTSPGYGESEEMVGKAVRGIRERIYVASKCGADPKGIPQQIDRSLRNMGLEYIDLYQLHYPRKDVPIAETIGAMQEVVRQGKARYIGVSNFSEEQLAEALEEGEIISCQSPYNLLWREIEGTGALAFCREHDVGILTYSSLAQGLLTGKFKDRSQLPTQEGEVRRRNVLFGEGIFEEALKVVEEVEEVAVRYGKRIALVALNWVICQPGVTTALAGARSLSQLEDNVNASGWKLSEEDVMCLGKAGERVSALLDYSRNMWGYRYSR